MKNYLHLSIDLCVMLTEAGAKVQENLADCNVVFGVKEFPIPFFHDNQAGMFFSHTIKGQKYNMPMLQKILDKKCTLMDYEKITNERLVFQWQA